MDKIEKLLKKYFRIDGQHKIRADGTVDVKGNVRFKPDSLLPQLPVTFGKVTGDFNCTTNQHKTLIGSPHDVNSFYCNGNNITDLIGAPQRVRGEFTCTLNNLKSLKGIPLQVADTFVFVYHKDMGLLRLITNDIKDIIVDRAPKSVENIIETIS